MLIALLVTLMTTSAYARDWDKEDKYSNPRARGVDSVYDEPRTSNTYDYNTPKESNREPYSRSYGNGSTSDGEQLNVNGLIINRDR